MPVCFKYSFDFNIFCFQSSSNFSYQYGSLALCQFSWCFGEIQFHWNTEAWSNHVRTDTNDLSASQNEGRRRRKCHFIWMFLRQQLSVKIISSQLKKKSPSTDRDASPVCSYPAKLLEHMWPQNQSYGCIVWNWDLYISWINNISIDVWFVMIGQYLRYNYLKIWNQGAKKSKYWENHL